eukprot:m.30082 g.30082  ORF g.30082 m.30082 type:complete len:81 (-) comp6203_c1_seq1:759-1001(-)
MDMNLTDSKKPSIRPKSSLLPFTWPPEEYNRGRVKSTTLVTGWNGMGWEQQRGQRCGKMLDSTELSAKTPTNPRFAASNG